MSQDLLSIDGIDDTQSFQALPCSAIPKVRIQAVEIIHSVLEGSNDANSDVVARLRFLVAAYPEAPERALLEHLIETGRLNRVVRQLS